MTWGADGSELFVDLEMPTHNPILIRNTASSRHNLPKTQQLVIKTSISLDNFDL
jgi:hypothetical protein